MYLRRNYLVVHKSLVVDRLVRKGTGQGLLGVTVATDIL